jgi:cation diffusion facilitator family transporter
LIVVILTALTMFMEIIFGLLSGSLALLTDGIHMGTHTFALMITLIAYMVTDRNRNNPNFAFSSGKISVLGGYTNAILLGMTALFMVKEAAERLMNPVEIDFTEAIIVAVLGLLVNLVSAFILGASHGYEHEHEAAGRPAGKHAHFHEDHNLKAAYVHVLTDALTSILAIFALGTGTLFGLTWPDAAVALLGAAVILKWAFSLLRSAGEILVDYYPQSEEAARVKDVVVRRGGTLLDLHIWKLSEAHKAAQVTVSGLPLETASALKEELRSTLHLDHINMELCS